ncbi:hypothetical protein B7486_59630, partial [cyanobacterium TDX16]
TFADERCGLDVPGLEVVEDQAEAAAEGADAAAGARAAVEASDPALAAAIVDLQVADDEGEVAEVFVTVDPSAGQQGLLQICEALSSYLYEELDADRAGISLETTDGASYASRFNDTADCQ